MPKVRLNTNHGTIVLELDAKKAPRTVENFLQYARDGFYNGDADRRALGSVAAQFFINVSDNEFLNFRAPTPDGWGYTVFGQVVEGMDVVDRIKGVKTTTRGHHQDVPEEDVVIESVDVEE